MATRNKATVLEVLTEIADLRGESSVNTDADRIRAVTKAEYQIAVRKMFAWLRVSGATTTGDGDNEYEIGSATYPMREKGLFEVYVGGTEESDRYDVISYEEYLSRYNANNADRIAYEYYSAADDKYYVYINPAPETGDTITYSYYYLPPKRTAITDSVVCGNIDALVRLATAYLYENEEEYQRADELKAEAEQIIVEVVGVDNSPNVNQLRTVSAIEGKGIGSY